MDKRFFDALLEKRQIPIYGKIDKSSFERICSSFMYLNAQSCDEVNLLIDSGGGFVGYGLDMFDVISASDSPVTGIVIGHAHSMAAVVLQGCTKRVAMPHSEICVHPIKNGDLEIPLTFATDQYPYGDIDMVKVKENLSRSICRMQAICKILSDRSGQKKDDIIRLINQGDILTAAAALDKGLIDEIA